MTYERTTTPPSSLASMLADARASSGLSIVQVEELTRIRASYISALEGGRFHELPPEIYARRILGTLAKFYGCDAAPFLQQYDTERTAFLRTEEAFRTVKLDRIAGSALEAGLPSTTTPISAYRLAGVTAAILSVLALAGYVLHQVDSFSAPPTLALEEPSGDVRVNHRTILVRGRADVGSTVSINNLAVLSDESGAFQVSYELSPGQNFITVVAQKKNGKTARVSHTVSADFVEAAPPVPDRGFLAVVSAAKQTWVRVKLDGEVSFEGMIEPQAERSFSGQEAIQIQTGNAGATRVAINGQDQGPLGRDGRTGSFIYNNPSTVGLVTPSKTTQVQ